MKSRLWYAVVAVIVSGCAGEETTLAIDACENFDVAFVTLDRFQQPVTSFSTTEVVRFQHSVRNRSNRQQMLNATSPGCGGGPIDVKNAAGTSVYSSGRDPGPAATCVVSPYQINFEPNETKTYSEDWNTPKSDGSSRDLPAGNYNATYSSDLDNCSATFDKSRAFSLR